MKNRLYYAIVAACFAFCVPFAVLSMTDAQHHELWRGVSIVGGFVFLAVLLVDLVMTWRRGYGWWRKMK